MVLTTYSLKNQGNPQFAQLFKRVFPYGIDYEKMKSPGNWRADVRARIFDFECNEALYIRCRCENCLHDSYMQVWDIAEALATQSHIGCLCGQGSYVQVFREK